MSTIGIDTSLAGAVTNSKTSSASASALDKDAFLQLLVAQMQYQDPLEPTSNTEYVAQLAQFSTVEELQNINSTFNANQSLNLAGQYVILNVPNAAGDITQVSGLVDYVTISEGDAYFSINGQYYSADYLDSVVSLDYLEYLVNNSDGSTSDATGDAANGEQDGSTGTDESGNN